MIYLTYYNTDAEVNKMKKIENEKVINIGIPEAIHADLRIKAIKERKTLKELIVNVIRIYLYNEPINKN
jgi:hydroxyethylthiazole kinase-like sugar kinase family protein